MDLSYYFQVLFSLALIIAVLYCIYYVSLKYKTQLFKGEINVVDRTNLDKQSSLVIIEYKEKQYMLGVSSQSVSLIKEMSL